MYCLERWKGLCLLSHRVSPIPFFHFVRIIKSSRAISKNLARDCIDLLYRMGNRPSSPPKTEKIIIRFFPRCKCNARSEVYLKLIVEKSNLGCVNVLSDSCIGKMSVPPIDNRVVSYLTGESRRRLWAIVSLKIPRVGEGWQTRDR